MFLSRRAVILALVLVGPLALPLLWRSPHFSSRTKIVLTLVSAAAAVIMVTVAFPLWENFTERANYLKEIQSL